MTVKELRDSLASGRALVDPLRPNAVLHDLGAEARLSWTTEEYTRKTGKPARRHRLRRLRLRLGQRPGRRPGVVSGSPA